MGTLSAFRAFTKATGKILGAGPTKCLGCVQGEGGGESDMQKLSELVLKLGISLEQLAEQSPKKWCGERRLSVENNVLRVAGCCMTQQDFLDLVAETLDP